MAFYYGMQDSVSKLKTCIEGINNSDWKENKYMSPGLLETFINQHLKLIANSDDAGLSYELLTLSNRINEAWDNPQAHNLAFRIMGISRGLLRDSNLDWQELPTDVWNEILSHTDLTQLASFRPSVKLSHLAQTMKIERTDRGLISLKTFGCKTAKEAVQFAVTHKLTGVNLSEFPDLTNEDLEQLFDSLPNLVRLKIQSNHITHLPEKAGNLQFLECQNCNNLERLPDLPYVIYLNLSGCTRLAALPEQLPLVQLLDLSHCSSLITLPEQLPQVIILELSHCESLTALPEQLPHVEGLRLEHCGWKLKKLPTELPNAIMLSCWGCFGLESLQALPQLVVLDCRECVSLRNLPELPKLEKLIYRRCHSDLKWPAFREGVVFEGDQDPDFLKVGK